MKGRTLGVLTLAVILAIAGLAVYFLVQQNEAHIELNKPGPEHGDQNARPATLLEAPLDTNQLPEAAPVRRRVPVPANAIDPQQRQLMLAALLQKLEQHRSGAGPAAQAQDPKGAKPHSPDEDLGSLPTEYIRQQIHEIIPLIQECYHQALDEDHGLSGKLTVRFSIVGDEDLGGLVEDSQIIDGDLKDSESLATCVRETMYALKLKPPKGGGRVRVTYPFIFHSSPEKD